jgi:hypothetical protein
MRLLNLSSWKLSCRDVGIAAGPENHHERGLQHDRLAIAQMRFIHEASEQ